MTALPPPTASTPVSTAKPPQPRVRPGRVPLLDAGPITRFDGLADDQPGRDRRYRIPVVFNPFLRLLIFVALMVACMLAIGLVAAFTLGPEKTQAALAHNSVASIIAIVVAVLSYLVLILLVERRRPPLELAPNRALGILPGLAIGGGCFAVCYALIVALGGYDVTLNTTVDWTAWWGVILMAGAQAGIVEEILFRGVILRFLEELLGTWFAVAASGLIFGIVHLSNPDATWQGAIGIALEAGLFFGVLYALTRSLWVLMGVHAAWNIVQGPLFGVAISGTGDTASILESRARGSELISGGIFGAEASFVTIAVMLAVTVFLAVRLHRRGGVVAPMWVRRRRQFDQIGRPSAQSLSAA